MSQALRTTTLGSNVIRNENQLQARKGLATRSTNNAQRAVLGEIGNRVKGLSVNNGPVKAISADARKPLVRSKATSSIRQKVEAPPKPVESKPFSALEENKKLNAYSSGLLNVDDIDVEDSDNPQLVSEYIKDIYLYLRYMEDKFRVSENHLRDSKITGKMREILIDWLVQVHLKFKLLHETLYLTVAIIDRFLQVDSSISPAQLQMVGVTAMWIASKYEEIYAPEVNDFVVIADKSFDEEQMRVMERQILSALRFDLGRPLPLHFLRRNSKAGCVDNRQHTLAKYLMELSLQEYSLAHLRVSHLAAAALCLSLKVLQDEETEGWTDVLTHYSFYPENELRPVMCQLASLVVKANEKLNDSRAKRVAVARKYATKKCLCISVLPELSGPVITELAAEAAV
ncbi:G2/mitotic-specific cyclin-B [Amphibalanus amphitrite]|uniref:G2/mitotic-specific cyclin-B n=1 Tax=Amphibalanus amphitrite TaxID=1232801 RepID=A0A6A4W186_AMPAM|nr:G2/mitotic-specific cyclin-B-like [Amphibalanus amphitrite]KAF0298999.1 G2/mitotic-specific cyclin-B [Amphibalanus amphitrite]